MYFYQLKALLFQTGQKRINKMELREIYKDNELSEIMSEENSMTLTASFVKTGFKNLNGRIYSEEIVKREIER